MRIPRLGRIDNVFSIIDFFGQPNYTQGNNHEYIREKVEAACRVEFGGFDDRRGAYHTRVSNILDCRRCGLPQSTREYSLVYWRQLERRRTACHYKPL
jgi:hypothetical protein